MFNQLFAPIDREQAAKTCEILATAMLLGDNRPTTTHDVAVWLEDVVAPKIREEL